MTNLGSILKSRDITLSTKVHLVKAMIFPVVMYGCESWTINELPVQVRCTILDAWGWCTGTTQRDGMGREEGGGFRMGNTCIPVSDSL